MPKIAMTALLLFAFAPLASADVIYEYTGAPFDNISGNWASVFGTTPTEITAVIDVPNAFPTQVPPFGGICGSVGSLSVSGMYSGILPPGFISATLSDGARTLTPDFIYLDGCGTTIMNWIVAGGSYLFQGSSDNRAIFTSNIGNGGGIGKGDDSFFVQAVYNSAGQQIGANDYDASVGREGVWTAVVTPEVNTGALALISGSLLLLGYRRRS